MKTYLVLIPIASAVLLGGCSLPSVSKTVDQTKQAVEQKAAETAILQNCKYDQAICQYMAAQMKAFASGMTLTSTTTNKAKTSSAATESITKMDGQGNMQIVSLEGGKEAGNMIVFNKVTYFKDYEDNQWLKMTSSDDQESPTSSPESFIENFKEDLNAEDIKTIYTKTGSEACDNLTCDVYEMYQQGLEADKTKIWIDTKEHLTRKMEMTLPDGGKNTITYAYGPVTIAAPSPVKEFSTPQFKVENGAVPSQEDIQKMMQTLPQTETAPDAGE